MHVAALYDIHGNLPALEVVLAEIERKSPDVILVGGDVSAGPFPSETLEVLRELGERARFIRGNADRYLAAGGRKLGLADAWCAEQLTVEQRRFLDGLPETITLDVDDLSPTLFCHGSPRSDEEMITLATTEARLLPMLEEVEERVVVCGHTHMQFDRTLSGVRIVNAGSVGMPYGTPGAFWALLGPGVELRRTEYDLEPAAGRIRTSAWPLAEEFAAENVLTVPSEQEATEFFERMAVG